MRYVIIGWALLFSNLLYATEQNELDAYFESIESEIIYGPHSVNVDGVVSFDVVYGQAYLNKVHITNLYRILGIPAAENVVGWVIPGTPTDDEGVESKFNLIKVEVADIGYIAADGDVDWDFDRIIETISEDQIKRGHTVTGWVEKPNYQRDKRSLKWSFEAKDEKNESFDAYQSLILGRAGVMGFSIVAPSEHRNDMLAMTHKLIDSAQFTPGNRYEDYVSGVDKEAAVGLAALVGGAAVAKKLGIFAIVLAFLVKFWKVIALAIGGITLVLGMKKKKAEAVEQ